MDIILRMGAMGQPLDPAVQEPRVLAFPGPGHEGTAEYERAIQQHAAHYATISAGFGALLRGSGRPDGGQAQLEALHELALEQGNLHEALHSAARRGQLHHARRLGSAVCDYLELTGSHKDMRDVSQMLELVALEAQDDGLALVAGLALASAHHRLNAVEAAEAGAQLARERATAAGREEDALRADCLLGLAATYRGDLLRAEGLLSGALATAQRRGDRRCIAEVLTAQGVLHYYSGDQAAGRVAQERALALWRELGNLNGTGRVLYNLALLYMSEGDYDGAESALADSLVRMRELGDHYAEGAVLMGIGNVAYHRGQYDRARELYEESLAWVLETGDSSREAVLYNNLGNVTNAAGDGVAARQLYERAAQMQRQLDNPAGEALALHNIGLLDHFEGAYACACGRHADALELRWRTGQRAASAATCAFGGSALGALGRHATGLLSLAGGENHYRLLGCEFYPDEMGALDDGRRAIAAGTLDSAAQDQVRQAAEALTLDELVEVTLAALRGV